MRPDVPSRPRATAPTDAERGEAIAAAAAEALGVAGRTLTASAGGAGGIGTRVFAPGRIVLALAGLFDRAGLERLRGLTPTVERQATEELIIDCSGLRGCDAALARVVGRLRIRRLAAEVPVELRDPPDAVCREVGRRPPGEGDLVPTDAGSDAPTDGSVVAPPQRSVGGRP